MTIERVIVKNYRALRSADITLDPELNVIVGDNESGKSTLLEAINLALRCQLNRRPAAYELHRVGQINAARSDQPRPAMPVEPSSCGLRVTSLFIQYKAGRKVHHVL